MYDYPSRIERIIEHSEDVRSFILGELWAYARPGQFAMLYLPGVGERPFTYAAKNMFTVRKVGPWTSALFERRVGDEVYVHGPLGQGFPLLHEPLTLVAGGIGMASLRMLALTHYYPVSLVLGAKTKNDLLYRQELEAAPHIALTCVTEDGSACLTGLVTDAAFPLGDYYAICGPELMMKAAAEKIGRPSQTYLVLERYMKCGGMGLCGMCSLDGWRVFVDGPVMEYSRLVNSSDFGVRHRDRFGRLVPISART